MRMPWRRSLLIVAVAFAAIGLNAQKPDDMVGTWIGLGTLEGEVEPNELTLVMEMKEGKLVGHMTGEYGTLNESLLREITLEKGIFSFTVAAEGPNGPVDCKFKMKVTGDSMEGELDIPDMGMSGTWEATKQK